MKTKKICEIKENDKENMTYRFLNLLGTHIRPDMNKHIVYSFMKPVHENLITEAFCNFWNSLSF